MACGWDREANVARASELVREAAGRGAKIILIQELFETPYFCKDELEDFYDLARPIAANPTVTAMSDLASELEVVLPVSVFERANNAFYNSLVMIDADGRSLGVYRKTHIPDAPGYSEKYYFNPGDTGFPVWQTRHAKIGTLICWDQWFPEPARILALKGAELLLYPTAIGSLADATDTLALRHWQTVMRGHAAANVMPVVASNRIGDEEGQTHSLRFFGSSFITDHTGEILSVADEESQDVLVEDVDLEGANKYRVAWNLFRDRRPEMYRELMTLDGCRMPASVSTPFGI
jgi:N-carbamoylputrescine amidase